MSDKKIKPMLAKDADLEKLKFPLAVQPKLDGIRAMVIDGKLRSRTLKPIPNAEIRAALEHPEFEGFDGEIVVGDPTAEDAYRKTASFVMSESKTGADWCFHVFDLWDDDGGFTTRHQHLREDWSVLSQSSKYSADVLAERNRRVRVLAYEIVLTADALEAVEELLIAEGCEGVIARTPDAPYKFGRSGKTGPLLKIKRFVDFEAEIIGVYEEMHNGNAAMTNELGRTERSSAKAGKVGKGTLGGFVLRAINGPAEGVEFRCGTGFDAAQRADLWAEWHTSPFPGRTVKVKSFPVGVKDKPRHPVYLGDRDTEVDG